MSLIWKIKLTDTAKKQLTKMDKTQANKIIKYLYKISALEDARSSGKALVGNLSGY